MYHSGDKADGLNFDIYFAMIGDDPEWKVGGTMKGYDPRPRMKNLTCADAHLCGPMRPRRHPQNRAGDQRRPAAAVVSTGGF